MDPANQQRPRALNKSEGWSFLQGHGLAQGRLIGGCVEVLQSLRGTVAWPNNARFEGAILFLETSEEGHPPSVLVRELRVYAAMGILQKLSGILVGRPGGQIPLKDFTNYDEAILQLVADEESLRELPIITRMDFGHTDPMFVLPYGVLAQIDCDKRQFAILENAVID